MTIGELVSGMNEIERTMTDAAIAWLLNAGAGFTVERAADEIKELIRRRESGENKGGDGMKT